MPCPPPHSHPSPLLPREQEVDEAHFGYSFKYLKNKPVKELNGEQFLKMCLAEEEGLLTIEICIDLMGIKGYGHVKSALQTSGSQ